MSTSFPETANAWARLVRSWRIYRGLRALEKAQWIAAAIGDRDAVDVLALVIMAFGAGKASRVPEHDGAWRPTTAMQEGPPPRPRRD